MHAVAGRLILEVHAGADADALHALRPQRPHVGGVGAHRGQGRHLVHRLNSRLHAGEKLRVETHGGDDRPEPAASRKLHVHRRIVDGLPDLRQQRVGVFTGHHADVETGLGLRRNHVRAIAAVDDVG